MWPSHRGDLQRHDQRYLQSPVLATRPVLVAPGAVARQFAVQPDRSWTGLVASSPSCGHGFVIASVLPEVSEICGPSKPAQPRFHSPSMEPMVIRAAPVVRQRSTAILVTAPGSPPLTAARTALGACSSSSHPCLAACASQGDWSGFPSPPSPAASRWNPSMTYESFSPPLHREVELTRRLSRMVSTAGFFRSGTGEARQCSPFAMLAGGRPSGNASPIVPPRSRLLKPRVPEHVEQSYQTLHQNHRTEHLGAMLPATKMHSAASVPVLHQSSNVQRTIPVTHATTASSMHMPQKTPNTNAFSSNGFQGYRSPPVAVTPRGSGLSPGGSWSPFQEKRDLIVPAPPSGTAAVVAALEAAAIARLARSPRPGWRSPPATSPQSSPLVASRQISASQLGIEHIQGPRCNRSSPESMQCSEENRRKTSRAGEVSAHCNLPGAAPPQGAPLQRTATNTTVVAAVVVPVAATSQESLVHCKEIQETVEQDSSQPENTCSTLSPRPQSQMPIIPALSVPPASRMISLRHGANMLRRQKSMRRASVTELPLLHEERSLDSSFRVTFLLPFGPLGQEFSECIRAGFLEAEPGNLPGPRQESVLVPYANNRTALVTLLQIGPVKALEHARRLQSNDSIDSLAGQGILELTDEMSALSSALVYVVCRHRAIDSAEQQLGPICAVEAAYAASKGYQPWRFLAALHEDVSENVSTADRERRSPGPFGEEVLRELQVRRVCGELPCRAVLRADIASHKSLLIYVVESLAAHFNRIASPHKRGKKADPSATPETVPEADFAENDALEDMDKVSRKVFSSAETTASPGSSHPNSPSVPGPSWPVSFQ